MTTLLYQDEPKQIPKHSINANMMNIKQFEKLISSYLVNGGVTSFLFGSSRSGKTTFLTKYMIPIFAKQTTVIGFLPNHVASIYDEVKRDDIITVLPELRTDVIRDIVDFQKAQMTRPDYKLLNDPPKWTFVLDDVTGDVFKNNSEVSRCYTTHRNLKISCITCAQYVMMAKKESRANVNISIYFKLNTPEARLTVVKDHLPDLFISKNKKLSNEEKADIYQALTEKYIIVSDNLAGEYHIIPRD